MFEFREYPVLTDNEIDIHVEQTIPANPEKGCPPSYELAITLHGTNEKIGGIRLRVGNSEHINQYIGHIGYGINESYRGHRYAAKACNLIKKVALDHGMRTLWITCNPDNIASRRTCDIIGCELVEIVDVPRNPDMYGEGHKQKCRYRWDI